MAIPKKIHYCWFGGSPLPNISNKCIESWKLYCPDYEIILWNESNCDFQINQFVKEAYEQKKWAFVSDYFRLKIIEENGGIYLDIDVELLRPLDDLLCLDGFMGFELNEKNYINSGLGFGAIAGHKIIKKLKENYEIIPFIIDDGLFDMTPCPERDTPILVEIGLIQNNITQEINGFKFFSAEYFSPIGFKGEQNFTNNTYSIHHFNASWLDSGQKKMINFRKEIRSKYGVFVGECIYMIYSPFKIIKYYNLSYLFKKIVDKFFNVRK